VIFNADWGHLRLRQGRVSIPPEHSLAFLPAPGPDVAFTAVDDAMSQTGPNRRKKPRRSTALHSRRTRRGPVIRRRSGGRLRGFSPRANVLGWSLLDRSVVAECMRKIRRPDVRHSYSRRSRHRFEIGVLRRVVRRASVDNSGFAFASCAAEQKSRPRSVPHNPSISVPPKACGHERTRPA